MRKTLTSLILAGSLLLGSCATKIGPFVKESFKEQRNIGILGYQTQTLINANRDVYLDRISVKDREVIYQEGSTDGYSQEIPILKLDKNEDPVGVIYSGKKLSIHTTKGVHNFRLDN